MKLKKTEQNSKEKLVTVKVSATDYIIMNCKAKLFTGGNISEWIRFSATELQPSLDQLVEDKAPKVKSVPAIATSSTDRASVIPF